MPKKLISSLIIKSLKNRPFIFWFLIRIVSTAGPLVTTYLFASVVSALENKKGIEEILVILGILLGVQIVENFLRLLSKTRIEYYSSRLVITLHQVLLSSSSNSRPPRKELVQAVINLCQSLDRFILYLKETGISGVVHFFIVPVILFFIWGSLQNIVAVFQFLVPLVVVADVIAGTRQISDLVLVVGYTKESQGFLNNFTSAYEKFMEVDAGIERLEEDSKLSG